MLALTFSLHAAEAETTLPADAPWKIHQTVRATYPARLVQGGITHGSARVRVSIADDGRLLDALLIACSQREFGDEALRVIKLWSYDAEREHGAAVGIVGDVEFRFEMSGAVAVERRLSPTPEPDDAADATLAYRAESLKRLDRIPVPTHVVPPVFPPDWSEHGVTGKAVVEFYIDETGHVRMPVVKSADYPQLAASAIAAVSQWQFDPPLRSGQPVLVRAGQTFNFPALAKPGAK